MSRRIVVLLFTLFAVGCATLITSQLDELYGPEQVQNRQLETAGAEPEFYRDVKAIVDARCVVCHSCLDAPCQLKMSSFEAIDRGAHKDKVYNGKRILSAAPSRMFQDAHSTLEWRDKGFYPVLNERLQSAEANLRGSSFYRALALKKTHPLPDTDVLPESFDFRLNRDQQCPTADEYEQYERDYPLWGMPYGLPAIADDEFHTLKTWIESGAKAVPRPPLSQDYLAEIERWETFLNQQNNKTKLVARYIYEHLYLANIYFPEVAPIQAGEARKFYKLVRSKTPNGQPVEIIATRRPFDDPGVETFYYRFVPHNSTVVAKAHMPYRLDKKRLKRWQDLFFNVDFEVNKLPGYKSEDAANPFVIFEKIPARSRYKFMLDEAQYTISGFIKGPVCRGQTALNVINDHFWVVFINPDHALLDITDNYLSEAKDYLRLPAGSEDNYLGVLNWVRYSRLQHEYEQQRLETMNTVFPDNNVFNMDLLWDGHGENQNAALTIFRHFDSASVVKGHVGNTPKTTWVISYTLLERIHYLLVSGFDVYGNVSHQLMTRLYMDFLRMEGEMNFLLFLPKQTQQQKLEYWYRDAERDVKDYLDAVHHRDAGTTGITFNTDNPQQEFLDLIHRQLGKSVIPGDVINRPDKAAQKGTALFHLQNLAKTSGKTLQWLGEQSVMRVKQQDGSYKVYTLILNLGHSNVSHLFGEQDRLRPREHTLTVVEGVLGVHPNVFFDVPANELAVFVDQFKSMRTEIDYRELLDNYGLRRTHPDFWMFSDWLHAYLNQRSPIEFGVLDYNRLENR